LSILLIDCLVRLLMEGILALIVFNGIVLMLNRGNIVLKDIFGEHSKVSQCRVTYYLNERAKIRWFHTKEAILGLIFNSVERKESFTMVVALLLLLILLFRVR